MMYSQKLAVAVKSNGTILREHDDTVFIPFGSEYSIFIKNLHARRASVSIQIDGVDVADGDTFIVNDNSSVDLERFLKNGNMNRGNRFKFIERTAGVEAHRGGPQVEDGLIRIEFEFEKEPVPLKFHTPWEKPDPWGYPGPRWGGNWAQGNAYGDRDRSFDAKGVIDNNSGESTISCSLGGAAGDTTSSFSASSAHMKSTSSSLRSKGKAAPISMNLANSREVQNDVGITAPGSISEQKFQTVYGFSGDGVKHVMVLKLRGAVGQKKVAAPITVKAKPTCVSCGRVNRATNKCCAECGTSLEIV